MPGIETIVDEFLRAFNETDPDRRHAAVVAAWAPSARFVDPRYEANGYEELDEVAKEVHAAFPGYRFRRTTPIEEHHGMARWSWQFVAPAGGPPVAAGTDLGVLADDGRLSEVIGFYDTVRETADA